ncbi:helix-turn-helix domain-containing protein [Halodesulfovibrio aestuarii]|uniref:Chromosomal replication initiator protein DnaA n=1 Tax=Halodesulfovibrio aestuarii TaxID=126333 RepID=A0A8G2CC30_9BACT|nr:DnaA/Hda family protein [Halodesulfovibrio aestuarii]SHJ70377.1 chromosomal replication initiator protein [Halodesulfovibrio aestuarii]
MLKNGLRNFLEQQYSEKDLRNWFDPLTIRYGHAEKSVSVAFPHAFFGSWFTTHGKTALEQAVRDYISPEVVVLYETPLASAATKQVSAASNTAVQETPASVVSRTVPNTQFTFDTFLHNAKNIFPVASAKEVAKTDIPPKYNPLVIAGPSGSGKTHLLRAIAHSIIELRGEESIFLGNIEDLASLYQDGSPGARFEMRKKIVQKNFFLLDDLQRLEDFPILQEELIALFDAFHDNNKQMVFCCTDGLTAHNFLLPTLRSRLEWGLLAQLKPQDMDIRIKYVTNYLKNNQIKLTNDQIILLCQRFGDFRLLQGVLLKLSAFKELMHTEVSEYEFNQIIEHTDNTKTNPLTPDIIIGIVAKHYMLQTKDLLSEKRHQKIVLARQIAMYLTRTLLGSSYPALGRMFGGKDHSTVIYAVNKIKKFIVKNKDTKLLINELKEKCLTATK